MGQVAVQVKPKRTGRRWKGPKTGGQDKVYMIK